MGNRTEQIAPSLPQTWAIVVGTRPEAIKMAPLMFAAWQTPHIQPLLIATGQHRQLLDNALADFELKPRHNLNVMRENQTLTSLTTAIMEGLAPLWQEERPDAVLVQGDTTTAFCAALSAFYAGIPVYHIEAGLRSMQLHAPFPEEANRALISRLARLHFAPTAAAREHLLREGITPGSIHLTGNTGVDALRWMQARLPAAFPSDSALLRAAVAALQGEPFVVVTAHRRESFGDGIVQLCEALRSIAAAFPRLHMIFPVHPNPHIHGPVHAMLGHHPTIHLLPPLDYKPFVWLMEHCHFIITDSGGVQEEAATLGKPLIVTRSVTERMEGVAQQSAVLAGCDAATIVVWAGRLLEDEAFRQTMAVPASTYGDGSAAARIVQAIGHDIAMESAWSVAV